MMMINRQAIFVRPAQPMNDWVRKVDVDIGNEPLSEEEIREQSNIYLIPEFDTLREVENIPRLIPTSGRKYKRYCLRKG